MFRSLIALILVFTPAVAAAQQLMINDIGLSSCMTYMQARDGVPDGAFRKAPVNGEIFYGNSERYAQWLDGYVTAYNYFRGPMVQLSDEERDSWMREFCRKNPSDTVLIAVNVFILSHAK